MPVSESIQSDLRYLRRYARALTGSQASGDTYVRATLEAALSDKAMHAELMTGRAALYRAFTRIWSSAHVADDDRVDNGGDSHEDIAQRRLARVPELHRQALLLTTLEDFSFEETAAILDITPEEAQNLVAVAIEEIEAETTSKVLIIEDEVLIAMQLADLVADLGHTVVGTAATRTEATRLYAEHQPGLIMADIQLADGSSGIDAVEDILEQRKLPVIFITAYPERLLTGERPEPTYLITKPFREETVRVAISQALFFDSTSEIG